VIADGRDNIAAELAPIRAIVGLPGDIDWDVLGRVAYTMVDKQTAAAFYETQASELEDF
jgi:hypothetical protein